MNTSHRSDARADRSIVSPYSGEPPRPERWSWVLPTTLAATIVVLFAALLVVVSRDAAVAEPPPPGSTVADEPSAANPAPVVCPTYVTNDDLPLRTCDQGDFVSLAQGGLNAWGAPIEVDGRFGPATAGAVRDFQASFGLATDAIIGLATWGQLCPFTTALCEPDGGEESVVVPSGIVVI